MSGFSWRWGTGFLAAVLPAILLVVTGSQSFLRASDTPPVATQPLIINTLPLEYRETGFTVENVGVNVAQRSSPFSKEPTATGKIARGTLKFAGGENNAIQFLWQREAGKLRLDLNRNQDLTDDPVCVALDPHQVNFQTFTNVYLSFNTPQGRCRILANLEFWNFTSQLDCSVAVRSFWQAKWSLAGHDWQVGLIPDFLNRPASREAGYLLLRPWNQENQPFDARSSSLATFPYPQKLFFGGHAWQLATEPPGNKYQPILKFTEQAVTLGDLKITGKFVKRLTMAGDKYLAVLDQPGETVKVPVGSYSAPNALLEFNGVQAWADEGRWQPNNRIAVTEKTPGILAVGGPLTNSVAVTRHGQDLRLDFQLVGASGQTYQLVGTDQSHPPEFAVFKGNKKIASGAFEFG